MRKWEEILFCLINMIYLSHIASILFFPLLYAGNYFVGLNKRVILVNFFLLFSGQKENIISFFITSHLFTLIIKVSNLNLSFHAL